MTTLITLKLFGAIATDFGGKIIEITVSTKKCTLETILIELEKLQEKHFNNYFDDDFTPKRGTLILINGVDYNTLDGLNTILTPADQVSLIPTISGG